MTELYRRIYDGVLFKDNIPIRTYKKKSDAKKIAVRRRKKSKALARVIKVPGGYRVLVSGYGYRK